MSIPGAVAERSSVPCPLDPILQRPHLESALTSGLAADLTLVSAGAGAGKTTLLTSWLAGHDDDGRFVRAIVEALANVCPIPIDCWGPSEAPIDILESALNELERREEACILVLDDVHELRSAGALACLTYLVDHAPSLLKIVI